MTAMDWIFGIVCGQNPAHTWMPGGELLPFCQRCTGLYVGAAIATGLHFLLNPRLSGPFLSVHGLFLLVMVPFGYHWIPQNAALRTFTGLLFGAGLVAFLLVSLRTSGCLAGSGNGVPTRWYTLMFLAMGAGVYVMASSTSLAGSFVLATAALGGVLALACLVAANVAHYAAVVWRVFQIALHPGREKPFRST